jgi:hypothetical protein
MTCEEVQRILPEYLEGRQDAEFGAHLRSCPVCSELAADLQSISTQAQQLSATDEPAPRLWVRIAAELRAEGILREPETAKPAPVAAPRTRWSVWWLVPVAAVLVAGASYLVNHQPAATVAVQTAAPVQTPLQTPATQAPPIVAQVTAPKSSAPHNTVHHRVVEPPPSADDQQFLSEVSQRAPSMRATYEDQLRSVNAYIRAAQAYLDQNPDDEDARQHLMEAYQQKALLYQLALDHIQ